MDKIPKNTKSTKDTYYAALMECLVFFYNYRISHPHVVLTPNFSVLVKYISKFKNFNEKLDTQSKNMWAYMYVHAAKYILLLMGIMILL